DPKARQLMTVRGIGPIIATAVIAKQTEPERFANARQFAAYFGAVPDQHSSGSKMRLGRTTLEQRYYLSSLAPDADRLLRAIRAHWSIENRLHWCMDVVFADDQMRARTGHAAHNLAVLKHITLNLIRLDPIPRKGGIKARCLIAATSDSYRAQLLGLT
ncbi:MAG: ISAs1 family transposase, partial [Betaproteobacteria bacterium]|nr:ISAs1 family transposase [Betaproteobacteria bacterium]